MHGENLAVVILLACFVCLFGEAMDCKITDWKERREVERVWQACCRQAMLDTPSWVGRGARTHIADKLFLLACERRVESGRPTIPRHLLGVPAAQLIASCA
jgi:hypothetical protein